MGEFLEFFVFWDVHEELGKTVQNQFSFINEDINLVL